MCGGEERAFNAKMFKMEREKDRQTDKQRHR